MSDALALVLQQAIRAERARKGLTQVELAERIGWSPATLSAVETGGRRIWAHELTEICEALEVTFAELLVRAPERDRMWLGGPWPTR